jgi:hypothetical protein
MALLLRTPLMAYISGHEKSRGNYYMGYKRAPGPLVMVAKKNRAPISRNPGPVAAFGSFGSRLR